ncbi:hypothetical protein F3Y22_tig00110610pilonHSYRG00329 [Hibiscus syriacus]|uniref:Uncharacterized protein n=1 Tax=Hibiscus syriacus TaxID=106335 RepID=A0A6A3A3A1_HIBSY|nr:hypothetical protein F3Y22_tig00110610pilonHSYRG00329 [Hibiscus syriacus]
MDSHDETCRQSPESRILFHQYSDEHNCPFNYRTAARDAIAKANPVVKTKKLDKI